MAEKPATAFSRYYPIALVAVVSIGVNANTLMNDFVFDDLQNILGNRWITDVKFLPDIFSTHTAGFSGEYSTSYYRPLVAERYLYLPTFGYAIVLAYLYSRAGKLMLRNSTPEALELNPRLFDARFNLGVAYHSKGLINQAIEQYRIILRDHPGSASAHNALGMAYGRAGSLDKAIEHFQSALDLDPGNEEAKRNLLTAHLMKNQADGNP
jgi:tetratricopeptide (TPR) repeat protein